MNHFISLEYRNYFYEVYMQHDIVFCIINNKMKNNVIAQF